MVTRFDTAAGKGDHAAMAQCARIMSHFPRGAETLINVCSSPAASALALCCCVACREWPVLRQHLQMLDVSSLPPVC